MINKIICIDDVYPETIQYFWPIKIIKKKYPQVHIIAFVVANYADTQNIQKSNIFKDWFVEYKDMVEIGCHGYDHLYPPEQERDDAKELVKNSLEILTPYLKKNFLYRPPGHQRTIHTENMLQEFGFGGIAYQNRIKYFDGRIIDGGVLNLHCTRNKFENPIMKVYENL